MESFREEPRRKNSDCKKIAGKELADILEVIKDIAINHGAFWDDIMQIAERKAESRGRFTERIVLERVREDNYRSV